MSKFIPFTLSSLLVAGMLFAQVATAVTPAMPAPAATGAPSTPVASDCASKAISKKGKPLAGAAKASFIKKCEAGASGAAVADSGCAAKAVSKTGKKLSGAAKNSFMKKCEADAKSGK